MKSGWIRYWLCLLAALFVANSVAAAARACVVELGGHELTASEVRDAGGDEHACQAADDAARCFAHCTQTQSVSNDAQRISSDASGFVPLLLVGLAHVRFQTEARLVATAPAAPVAGPPLTILFRRLRI
jgi:hypothetical protein